jgi:hypothetical protein
MAYSRFTAVSSVSQDPTVRKIYHMFSGGERVRFLRTADGPLRQAISRAHARSAAAAAGSKTGSFHHGRKQRRPRHSPDIIVVSKETFIWVDMMTFWVIYSTVCL